MEKRQNLALYVKELQSGKEEAFTKLYEAYFSSLEYYIEKIVNDKTLALDLTQESFIEIYQKIGDLKEPEAFLKWSRKIAYYKCTAYFRKKKDVLLEETEDDVSLFDTLEEEREEFIPDEALDKDEVKKAIREMIESLPEEQRAAIMMRYFDEMSVQDIAEIQNVSEGTVKSRLNYGRKSIKTAVEEYEKKTGVKLRCAGVLPLVLWAFRGYWKMANVPTAGATAITTGLKGVVKEGAKKGIKSLATKVVIGAVATTVVIGGGIGGAKVVSEVVKDEEDTYIEEVIYEEEPWDEVVMEVVYGSVFGTTLVISMEPIETYEGKTADVKGTFEPYQRLDEKKLKKEITKIVILDNFDEAPQYLDIVFKGYYSVETIEGLENIPMGQWRTTRYMFDGCSSLTAIKGVENWDMSEVSSMEGMFRGCTSLTDIDALRNWEVNDFADMEDMFSGCESLMELPDWYVEKGNRKEKESERAL